MYHQLKSLVLRARVSDEADKLLTVYTCEWGKISAIVPGAKKIRAKLAAATEPVTESELMVYVTHPQARGTVTGARIVDSFPALKSDWRRFTVAQYCAEIGESLTPFNAENSRKYDLLARTWKLLERAEHPWRIYAAFVLRFLKLSGYSFPEYLKREKTSVRPEEKEVIQKLASLPGEDVDRRLEIAPEMERNVQRHIESYLDLYLPRPLASREFVEKIMAADAEKNAQKTGRP